VTNYFYLPDASTLRIKDRIDAAFHLNPIVGSGHKGIRRKATLSVEVQNSVSPARIGENPRRGAALQIPEGPG
jgi:hypothetical protein